VTENNNLEQLIKEHIKDKALREQLLNSPDLQSLSQAIAKSFDEMQHRAYHDSLTGLPNRQAFYERLENTLIQAQRTNLPFSLLFIDLDHFKAINDHYGHEAGDQLLKEVANRFKSVLRESDMVARISGDEFCILLSNIESPAHSARVVRTLFNQFRKPVELANQQVDVHLSVGISHFPDDGNSADELLRHADIAMYEAKQQEENSLHFYEKRLTEQVSERVEFERDLSAAINNDQLHISLIPNLETATGKLIGAQASLDWQHPVRGVINSSHFFDVATDKRLLLPLLKWFTQACCEQLVEWHQQYQVPLQLSIPVDYRQFLHQEFLDCLTKIAKQFPKQVDAIELLVDEKVVSKDPTLALQQFRALHQLGFQSGLSGCGRGLLPAGFFKRGRISTLEIDSQLLSNMLTNEESKGMVKGMIVIADSININSRAVGLTSFQQIDLLESLNCQQVQGPYFSEALSTVDFKTIIARFVEQPLESEAIKTFTQQRSSKR
jgi:diguanylate cyclase (GGDEF)-like protein